MRVSSNASLQVSTCRIGSKFLCIRSTPTEMWSISENDFECLARTGVNAAGRMFQTWTTPHQGFPDAGQFPKGHA